MASGKYDLLILDEINVAVWFGLFTEKQVTDLLDIRPENVEMVLTGRNAPGRFIAWADLVTEMKEVKHYYARGVLARDGIER
ncbi:MAG: cob(I)yrinic acid a,c-diamide adenosyltransferase [Desulfobacterales bacterium]